MQHFFTVISALLACYMLLFLLSMYLRDNSIADIFWGFGFVIITILSYFLHGNGYNTQVITTILITIWGLRLSYNIGKKKFSHSGEDARYARWRKQWKYFYTRSFFQIYLFQGLLMCIIATPIFLINFKLGLSQNYILTSIGGVVAIFGLCYEIIADRQLAKFMNIKKKGEILTTGLRTYSRYPQYFGESIFWLGISLIALQVSAFALVGWGVITFLLLHVSGIPLLEARYAGVAVYQKYSEYTPKFFPNFFIKNN